MNKRFEEYIERCIEGEIMKIVMGLLLLEILFQI